MSDSGSPAPVDTPVMATDVNGTDGGPAQEETPEQTIAALKAKLALAEAQCQTHWELLCRIHDLVVVFDMAGILLFVSPSCKQILGWSPEELFNRPISNAIAKDCHSDFEMRVRSMMGMQQQQPLAGEDLTSVHKFIHRDGSEVYLAGKGQAWQRDDVVEFVMVYREWAPPTMPPSGYELPPMPPGMHGAPGMPGQHPSMPPYPPPGHPHAPPPGHPHPAYQYGGHPAAHPSMPPHSAAAGGTGEASTDPGAAPGTGADGDPAASGAPPSHGPDGSGLPPQAGPTSDGAPSHPPHPGMMHPMAHYAPPTSVPYPSMGMESGGGGGGGAAGAAGGPGAPPPMYYHPQAQQVDPSAGGAPPPPPDASSGPPTSGPPPQQQAPPPQTADGQPPQPPSSGW